MGNDPQKQVKTITQKSVETMIFVSRIQRDVTDKRDVVMRETEEDKVVNLCTTLVTDSIYESEEK